MSDFPNAPASHSALFDNAPTVSNMNTTADVSVTSASVPQTLTVHLTPRYPHLPGQNGALARVGRVHAVRRAGAAGSGAQARAERAHSVRAARGRGKRVGGGESWRGGLTTNGQARY